jgi:hypothetical protein
MASPLSQTSRQTTSDRLYFRTVPSKTIVVARSFSLDSEDTNAVSDPSPRRPQSFSSDWGRTALWQTQRRKHAI